MDIVNEEKPTQRGRRDTPIKHPVAVVRAVCGLSQEQLSHLLGVSRRTVQAIELGQLRLSPQLAIRLENETGAGSEWLLAGDPAKPAITKSGEPYTHAAFLQAQAQTQSRAMVQKAKDDETVNLFFTLLGEARKYPGARERFMEHLHRMNAVLMEEIERARFEEYERQREDEK